MQASIGFILAVMARTGYVWLRLELNMTSLWEWETDPRYPPSPQTSPHLAWLSPAGMINKVFSIK